MNFQKKNNRFKVVISVGDESGIGPEIILKALSSNEIPTNVDFILVGSKKNLLNTYTQLRSQGVKNLCNPNDLQIDDPAISSSNDESKSSYGDSSFNYLPKEIDIVKE